MAIRGFLLETLVASCLELNGQSIAMLFCLQVSSIVTTDPPDLREELSSSGLPSTVLWIRCPKLYRLGVGQAPGPTSKPKQTPQEITQHLNTSLRTSPHQGDIYSLKPPNMGLKSAVPLCPSCTSA